MTNMTAETLVQRLRSGVYGINRIALCEEAAAALEVQAAQIAEREAAKMRKLYPSEYCWAEARLPEYKTEALRRRKD